MKANKEWLKDIKISQELKDKIYYDKENDLWVISWNAVGQSLEKLEELKKKDMAMKPVEAMITWQCGNCGKEIRNTFNSCPYCRTRIDWSDIYGSDKDE